MMAVVAVVAMVAMVAMVEKEAWVVWVAVKAVESSCCQIHYLAWVSAVCCTRSWQVPGKRR